MVYANIIGLLLSESHEVDPITENALIEIIYTSRGSYK